MSNPVDRVKCEFCPIEMDARTLIESMADGWDGTHTFVLPFVNEGQATICRGKFRPIAEDDRR